MSFVLITMRGGRKAVLCLTYQLPLTKRCSRDPVPVGVKELLVAVHHRRRGGYEIQVLFFSRWIDTSAQKSIHHFTLFKGTLQMHPY